MTSLRVVGVDPGPVPGIVMLDFEYPGPVLGGRASVLQADHATAPLLFDALLRDRLCRTVVQVETFVVGRSSMKSGRPGAVTRDLVGVLQALWQNFDATRTGRLGGHWFQVPAGGVKPWATDERLEAAGLLEATKGMRHAKDAARHALYRAVKLGAATDPLSRKAHV